MVTRSRHLSRGIWPVTACGGIIHGVPREAPDPIHACFMNPIPFLYDGNLLCVDLVNTRPVLDGATVDLLPDFPELVGWLEGAGVLTAAEAGAMTTEWTGTTEARQAMDLATELREAVKSVVDHILAGQPVGDAPVDVINRALGVGPSVGELFRDGDRFRRRRRPTGTGPSAPLSAVADSAATLLADLDWARLGQCADPACVLYFYDTSKNRARRWCSMERCGNRAKVGAYREARRERG